MAEQVASVSFGEHLRRYRERVGLTQEQLAAHAGVSAKAISALERNTRRQPYPQTVQALATALGLSKDEYATLLDARSHRAFDPSPPSLPMRSPSTVPVSLTPLVGRAGEVVAVEQLLGRAGSRLLTLTGPGGVGKTRLALAVASASAQHFAHGVAFIALAPLADAALVIPTMARTLGVAEGGEHARNDILHSYLQDKHLLVVLDNCEHVLDAAPHIAALLLACPHLTIVATSRAPLQVRGEQEYAVGPLALPPLNRVPVVADVADAAAVRLFVARAQQAVPTFRLGPDNAAAVAAICRRLDGLPLALELAAARVKLLTPTALLARLDHALPLLIGGARDLPARQQTLRRTLDWSYELLAPADQRVFRTLAVFAGGWTLEAAEAVCRADGELPLDILDGLQSLVDKSLVQQAVSVGTEIRFTMLETIREFALERLENGAEAKALRQAHAIYYLTRAEDVEPLLRGPHQRVWLDRLKTEHDNLRAALQWLFENGDREQGLRLAGALVWFWLRCDYYREQQHWLDHALALAREVTVSRGAPLAKVLVAAAGILHPMGDPARHDALYAESLAVYRQVGDRNGAGLVLVAWGRCARFQGDYARAHTLMKEGLALYRALGNQWGMAFALTSLGDVALDQGQVTEASAWFGEGLTLFRLVGDHAFVGWALVNLGRIAYAEDEYQQAQAWLEESQACFGAIGLQVGVAQVCTDLGHVARKQGDLPRARALYRESLVLAQQCDVYRPHLADTLEGLAMASVASGELQYATRLLGAAGALREAFNAPHSPHGRAEYERQATAARTHLDDTTFAAAWSEGRAMTLEQVITYAVMGDECPPT